MQPHTKPLSIHYQNMSQSCCWHHVQRANMGHRPLSLPQNIFFANQARVWGQLTNGKPGKAQLICELCRKSDVMMVNVLCVNVLECSFAAFHTHWCCGWFSVTSVLLETVQLYITVVQTCTVRYCTQSDQQSFCENTMTTQMVDVFFLNFYHLATYQPFASPLYGND